ncbi:choline/ethanolaminephosphotransferase 1 [[Candida] railenensis]|uniref:diacylglycerol cholinephosphotransferase n=1 Tax=[Candida] railenensis TaxID=45579 RepID=A0A9P0QLM3_9ASCO|nr:choline/ethanolaminephosphotransferase 1 [[Candida] railenensis]
MGVFIPANKLANLKLYKYQSEDHSVVSKLILKSWWNNFVKIFPLWMAPNVITLTGLFFIFANLAVVFYYDPTLEHTTPRWTYFFYAFGLFMYQTFDGCDGAHARRTGQSGPLGELFDHSIDAVNTTLGVMVFASVFQMGHGIMLLIAQFATVCNFYTSTWEEYHTHTLFLSHFSGPVEGILIVIALYLITGIFGPGIWTYNLLNLDLSSLGLSSSFKIDASIVYVMIGVPSLYFNIATAVENVKKYYRNPSRSKLSTVAEQEAAIQESYKGLLPFAFYYASVVLYLNLYPGVLPTYGFPLLISIGLTVAFSVGRMILAHLTLQDFPYIQAPMFLPVSQISICWLLTNVYGFDYDIVLGAVNWIGLGLTLGIHAMFVTEMIYEITTYLDIYTLSIKHKKH